MITGRILRTEESTEGYQNIKIIVEFSEDGKVIVPEWTLWAQFRNFLGMTASEISEWIRINIEHHIGNLIQERSKPILNAEFMVAIEKLKATTFQTDKVEIPIERSKVIDTAYKVILNADGTYTVVR
jgi:hypothetical protein